MGATRAGHPTLGLRGSSWIDSSHPWELTYRQHRPEIDTVTSTTWRTDRASPTFSRNSAVEQRPQCGDIRFPSCLPARSNNYALAMSDQSAIFVVVLFAVLGLIIGVAIFILVTSPARERAELPQVGSSGANEALTSGTLVLRIEFASPRGVMLTLDQGSGPRTWYSGMAPTVTLSPRDSVDDSVRRIVQSGVAAVRSIVPSAQPPELQVQLDQTDQGTEVVCSGNIQFLRSEWEGYKQKVMAIG